MQGNQWINQWNKAIKYLLKTEQICKNKSVIGLKRPHYLQATLP